MNLGFRYFCLTLYNKNLKIISQKFLQMVCSSFVLFILTKLKRLFRKCDKYLNLKNVFPHKLEKKSFYITFGVFFSTMQVIENNYPNSQHPIVIAWRKYCLRHYRTENVSFRASYRKKGSTWAKNEGKV